MNHLRSRRLPARYLPALLALLLTSAAAGAQDPGALELDTLHVVVASRASTLATATRGVQVLDADAIRRIPARTVADVLAWTLGTDVLARSAAQTDVAMRGSTFEQVLVLVDGVRMNDPQTGHFALNLAVPVDEIERIEVLRGAASSLYGSDALGGVIQIVTRRGGGRGFEAGVEGGSFGTAAARLAGGGMAGPVRSRVAAEARRSDGHRPGTDSRSLVARATLETELAGGSLRADLGLALRDFGARHFYTSPEATFDEYERTRAATATLGWRAAPGSGWSVEPRLSARRHADEFLLERDDPDFYRNVHTSWQLGGEVVARTMAGPGSASAARSGAGGAAVSLGVEAFRDLLESTNLGDPDEVRLAAFGELALGATGGAVAHVGLRADHHSAYGAFVAPSLAVAGWLAPAVKLRASAGRSFRAPNWTERYYRDPANEGDPDLRPETSWNGEAAIELGRPAGDAALSLAGFVRDARDLIDWARPAGGDDPIWRTMNVGRAVFRGLEIDARARDPLGTRWRAQVGLLDFSVRGDVWESKYALRPLTRTATLTAARPLAGVDATVRALYARRVGEAAYLTGDARLSRPLGQRLRVDLDVTNLAGARFLDVTGLHAPGRALYLGLVYGPRTTNWDRNRSPPAIRSTIPINDFHQRVRPQTSRRPRANPASSNATAP